jgi:hypothetical protein
MNVQDKKGQSRTMTKTATAKRLGDGKREITLEEPSPVRLGFIDYIGPSP